MLRTATKRSPTKPTRPKRMRAVSANVKRPEVDAAGYAVGIKITHPQFGDGTVTAVEVDKLTIKFRDGRVRQILNYYVKRRDR